MHLRRVFPALSLASALLWVKAMQKNHFSMRARISAFIFVTGASSASAMAAPTALKIATPAQTIQAGKCSGIATVQSVTSTGTASSRTYRTTVNLAGTSLQFFSDSACSAAVSSVSIPAYQTKANFYFKSLVAATRTLTASASGLTAATQSEKIMYGPATQVWIQASPGAMVSGAKISPSLDIRIEDAYGNFVLSSGAPVTVSIAAGSPAGTLGGTTQMSAAQSRALFTNLTLTSAAGGSFRLQASSPGLKTATSAAFNVQGGTSPQPTPTPTPTPSPTATPTPKPTPTPTPTPTPSTPPIASNCTLGQNTSLNGYQVFPGSNEWNRDISNDPVDANSSNYIASIGATTGLHPDFGTVWNGAPNGIPYVVVPGNQPRVPVTFEYYSESDAGPYPIPANAPIQGGPNDTGDRHVIAIDCQNGKLYEMFSSYPNSDGSWRATSGAVFDMKTGADRPAGWTSADAAGLPIFPGLVRYDEVTQLKEIRHALRFTVQSSQRAYIYPARHWASSSTNANLPPMGLRLRLKASFDISGFPPNVQVILRALKKYGMFVADNGANWFIQGSPSPSWNDSELATIKAVKGSDFEVVRTGTIVR